MCVKVDVKVGVNVCVRVGVTHQLLRVGMDCVEWTVQHKLHQKNKTQQEHFLVSDWWTSLCDVYPSVVVGCQVVVLTSQPGPVHASPLQYSGAA